MRAFGYNSVCPFWGRGGNGFWDIMQTPGGIAMGIFILAIVGIIIYLLVSRSRDRQEFTRFYSSTDDNGLSSPISGYSAGRKSGAADEDPLDIVRKRYAEGKITKDEYEQLKKDLEQ
jgi:hypothetical protein